MNANSQPTLLLIDGHSLAFRAFYALSPDSFKTPDGQHTNAVHGFISMMLNILQAEKPTHLAVAFDLSRSSFRTEEYPEYKGTRGETPPEFVGQTELLQEALEAMNIKTITRVNYEADDILASGGTIDRLVYVAAVLPRNGKCQSDYTALPEGEGDGLRGGLDVSGDPKLATLKPGVAYEALFGHCEPETAVAAEAMLEPQVIRVLFAPVAITDDRPISRSFVVCSDDKAIPAPLQRRMAAETPGVKVVEMNSDHSPFLSHRDEFVDVIDALITE